MTNLKTALILAIALFSAASFAYWIAGLAAKEAEEKKRRRSVRMLWAFLLDRQGKVHSKRLTAKRNQKGLLNAWIALNRNMTPPEKDRQRIAGIFLSAGTDLIYIRQLSSHSRFSRCEAAHHLAYTGTERAKRALVLALRKERHESVKLYLIQALCVLGESAALPDIVDSVQGGSKDFILRVAGMITDFNAAFIGYLDILTSRSEPEITELTVELARIAPYKMFVPYLQQLLADPGIAQETRLKVFSCLAWGYPQALNAALYLHDSNAAMAEKAFEALADHPGKTNALILIREAQNPETAEIAQKSLSRMTRNSTSVLKFLMEMAETEKDEATSRIICRALASRLEYLLMNPEKHSLDVYEKILAEVIEEGKVSDLIAFLNENRDPAIEERLLRTIRTELTKQTLDHEELQMYLRTEILQKIGLSKIPVRQKRIGEKRESVKRAPLVAMLACVLAIYPVLVVLFADPQEALLGYMSFFGWYAFAANSIYLILAALSHGEARKQTAYARIKNEDFLFRKNMLPSISIIAPAYNEELGIVGSVESLLNARYPDFEVIVVNDGSKDGTLARLITRFNLERMDTTYKETLRAQPVRGIYKNPGMPELTVIDKINGGKADSLNVGINAAAKEYILGIDADSILDRDSLLELTSDFIDSRAPVIASGGNILPVNGCSVDRGLLTEKRIPNNRVALLQTIEYLRAFMAGRLGWARLNSLMIISGAFGIFRRKEVLAINGYLTSSEKHQKDTVGEDMELVVRMARHLHEKKEAFRITYNYRANCWTEVPSTFAVLKKQRDRWQRGLIDILSYHSKILLSPKYGSYGWTGFPYYLIFEVLGPWLELLGYVLFFAGLLLGWIASPVVLFLLSTNLVYSFAISVFSLCIANTGERQFDTKDQIVLMIASLVETAGFRQIISFFRITGFLSVLFKVTGWGAMKRTGFRTGRPSSKSAPRQ